MILSEEDVAKEQGLATVRSAGRSSRRAAMKRARGSLAHRFAAAAAAALRLTLCDCYRGIALARGC